MRIAIDACLNTVKGLHMAEMLEKLSQKVQLLRIDDDDTALKEIRRSEFHYDNTKAALSVQYRSSQNMGTNYHERYVTPSPYHLSKQH